MTPLEKAMRRISQHKETLVYCENSKEQESTRVRAYAIKNKIFGNSVDVGISKVEVNGKLFVKIFLRKDQCLYEIDPETGDLVQVSNYELNPELQRIVNKMQEDGVSDNEIQEYIKEWEKDDGREN